MKSYTNQLDVLLKIILFILAFTVAFQSIAQVKKYTVSGVIIDSRSQEPLLGATAKIENALKGGAANFNGKFSFRISEGAYTVEISCTGYESKKIDLNVTADSDMGSIPLKEYLLSLGEVVVESNTLADQFNSMQMSVEKLNKKQIEAIPVLLGEPDLIKTLQLKPGIQSGSEGNAGLYVRGGNTDQNLVLLDNATIYNPTHFVGLFSVFNSKVIKDVSLYKGGFPAQYGQRLSSVLDIGVSEGNMQKREVEGSVGILFTKLQVEGPIKKDKLSYNLAGRYFYINLITESINSASPPENPIPNYFFYDLNGKISYQKDENTKINLNTYSGRDKVINSRDNFSSTLKWGNDVVGLEVIKTHNRNWESKQYINFARFASTASFETPTFRFGFENGVLDLNLQTQWSYLGWENHSINLGGAYTYHGVTLGEITGTSTNNSLQLEGGSRLNTFEAAVYASDQIELNSRLTIIPGIRLSAFFSGNSTYIQPEPRFSSRFKITDKIALKASYMRVFQFLSLISNSATTLPSDLWYPSTEKVKPLEANQIAGGISFLLGDGKYLLSNELYYKDMKNNIDLADGGSLFGNPDIEEDLAFGDGWAYGNEVYIEKKNGRLTGWIGYTLSWSFRKYPNINNGVPFSPTQDRRHDVSVVLQYKLNDRISLSSNWVYGSGDLTTTPEQLILLQNIKGSEFRLVPIYRDRNTYRVKPYNRMDLGITYQFRPRWGKSSLTLSFYNIYNRRNVYFIYFEPIINEATNIPERNEGKQASLLPLIPALTYTFSF